MRYATDLRPSDRARRETHHPTENVRIWVRLDVVWCGMVCVRREERGTGEGMWLREKGAKISLSTSPHHTNSYFTPKPRPIPKPIHPPSRAPVPTAALPNTPSHHRATHNTTEEQTTQEPLAHVTPRHPIPMVFQSNITGVILDLRHDKVCLMWRQ